MKTKSIQQQLVDELDKTSVELAQINLYLEGSLQKSVKRYTKRDGTVSEYELPPVLQYPKEGGGQKQMRIPRRHVDLVKKLLIEGTRRQKLLKRHRALSFKLAKLQLRSVDEEKKTPLHISHSHR